MDNAPILQVNCAPTLEQQTSQARGLFYLGLVWLGCLSVVLHFHERPSDAPYFWSAVAGLGLLTPVFWGEALAAWWRGAANRGAMRWVCLLPAIRLGVRDPIQNSHVWLPRMGWRKQDSELANDVQDALSGPMLAISLLVLPVILVEFLLAERLESDWRLARATQFGTALIWWAFTIEFILMVSVTEKKLAYCKKHWLDLAIILLPLLAFLRALRLGRLLRLQNLSKTARMYKLRGVAMRTYRALLLIDAVQRLLEGKPERRLVKLRQRLADQEQQLAELRAEIQKLELRLETVAQQTAA